MIREAKTENGWVRGIEAADPRITVFKGIPFAAPPIGENRWRAPQPAADWEGVRDASRFAPISMQSIPGLGTDVYCKEVACRFGDSYGRRLFVPECVDKCKDCR